METISATLEHAVTSNAVAWVLWWWAFSALTLWLLWRHQAEVLKTEGGLHSATWSVVLLMLSVLFWLAIGEFQLARVTAIGAMSFAAFSLGSLIGFVFSSYDDEASSIGKVRDWLLGGLGTLALADTFAGSGRLREGIMAFATPAFSSSSGVALSVFLTYLVVGFYGLFVLRKLEWNAKFIGGDSLRVVEAALAQADLTRSLQVADQSPEVTGDPDPAFETFIKAAEAAIKKQVELPREVVAKLARAYLYTRRFSEAARLLEGEMALSPSRDAASKLAQALTGLGQRLRAGALLLQYDAVDPGSTRIARWLGYLLLWDEGKLGKAVEYGSAYLKAYPGDGGALLNLACAHAQKHFLARQTRVMGGEETTEAPEEKNSRAEALKLLRLSISADPRWKKRAEELKDDDFASLSSDPDFQAIIAAA